MGREYHRDYSRKYYHKRRSEIICLLGSKCVVCGSIDYLEIDHIDHNLEKIKIGKLLNYKWSIILKEINKCQLLCNTCHKNKTKNEKSYLKNKALGERVSTAKLTEINVYDICRRIKNGDKLKDIALDYNVSRTTISHIKSGKNWSHLKLK